MRVHKFGGSSLADSKCFNQVFNIITKIDPVSFVVVSATYQTTNQLIELTDQDNLKRTDELLKALLDKHIKIMSELDLKTKEFENYFSNHSVEIKALLQSISILKERTPSQIIEIISGYGELWSSFILTELLKKHKVKAKQIDARNFLTVKEEINGMSISYKESKQLLDKQIEEKTLHVITGYWARDQYGVATTLKRNGSDFSAAIVGNLIDAKEVSIWTDVSGVCSADPRIVKNAEYLKSLSYDEAIELAHFGAKVIHPKTMVPLMKKDIPIVIKNTFSPEDKGTYIIRNANNGHIVKGFTVMEDIALFNIEGSALVGLPGTAGNIFAQLKEQNISVILITQGSSEYSISFAIDSKDAEKAKAALNDFFNHQISKGKIKPIEYNQDCVIIAAVGDKMSSATGVAGKIFNSLGDNKINIKAIAQGSSERNISLITNKKDKNKALQCLHDVFFKEKHFNVFLIGTGGVGKEFLKQINTLDSEKVRVVGLCNSKQYCLSNDIEELSQGHKLNFDEITQKLKEDFFGEVVIVDCTSSELVVDQYLNWSELGFHIITPNKKANTRDIKFYKNLMNQKNKYYYETTVGAGLPVINTLKSLINSGDTVVEIEAVLSGTLSYIFNNLSDKNFSEIVNAAYKLGYTEPDPRDDLGGMDVARKALILSRELGLTLSLDDIKVESLYPKELESLDVDDFLDAISQKDHDIEKMKKENHKLAYIAHISAKGIEIQLKSVDSSNPFYSLNGTDNMVVFKTQRYNNNPLVIKGPGAGVEVTAAGVLADLIQLTKEVNNV